MHIARLYEPHNTEMDRLITYLKNPDYCEIQKPKAIYFGILMMVYVLCMIPVAVMAFFICRHFHIVHHSINLSPQKTVLIGMILAPVYEEVISRSLLKFTKRNLVLFFLTVSILIVVGLFRSKTTFVIILSVMLLVVMLSLLLAGRYKTECFIAANFKYFFYGSALAFGLAHAANFGGNVYVIVAFSFILGGPQIIAGLILGFIRMNYGLVYSILFHMLINSSMVFVLL